MASTGDYGAAGAEYPAFSPNVVAVGGTSLYLNADGSYDGETGWKTDANGKDGGCFGSGGGVSQYEAEPSFQIGVQSTGFRTTPDVSFVADPQHRGRGSPTRTTRAMTIRGPSSAAPACRRPAGPA